MILLWAKAVKRLVQNHISADPKGDKDGAWILLFEPANARLHFFVARGWHNIWEDSERIFVVICHLKLLVPKANQGKL